MITIGTEEERGPGASPSSTAYQASRHPKARTETSLSLEHDPASPFDERGKAGSRLAPAFRILKEIIVKINFVWTAVPAALLLACGASFPVPTQRMADAEAAHRSALELGAANQPAAQLHVKLAEEQMTKAKTLISEGDNKAADSLLIRSKADSELALALAREQSSNVEVQKAVEKSNSTAVTNASQGAVK